MTSEELKFAKHFKKPEISINLDKLIKDSKTVKKNPFIKPIIIENLMEDDLTSLDKVNTAIYIIEQTEGCPCKAHKDYQEFKDNDENKEIKLSGKNECPSRNMYVGSSTSGIKTRLEEHKGTVGSDGTYALKLCKWFNGKCKVHIFVYDNIEKGVIRIVEEAVHGELKPAFGKKGSRGK